MWRRQAGLAVPAPMAASRRLGDCLALPRLLWRSWSVGHGAAVCELILRTIELTNPMTRSPLQINKLPKNVTY